jgi:hypothetical protein
MSKRAVSALAVCWSAFAPAACGAATLTDLQIAIRALGFLQPPLSGEVRVGIVYEPGSLQSAKEAADIRALIGDGLTVGNLTLHPVLLRISELAAVKVGLYILAGAVADAAAVATITQQKHIPCVTMDIAQVRSGNCFLGIQSSPKIEILVNRAAAASSGAVFSSVFRIMITEL